MEGFKKIIDSLTILGITDTQAQSLVSEYNALTEQVGKTKDGDFGTALLDIHPHLTAILEKPNTVGEYEQHIESIKDIIKFVEENK